VTEGPHIRLHGVKKVSPCYLGIAAKEIMADEEQLRVNLEWLAARRQHREDQQ